jgi:hypothetical protein
MILFYKICFLVILVFNPQPLFWGKKVSDPYISENFEEMDFLIILYL